MVVKRCPHCTKKMKNIGTENKPQWVCENHEYPIYVPPLPENEKNK